MLKVHKVWLCQEPASMSPKEAQATVEGQTTCSIVEPQGVLAIDKVLRFYKSRQSKLEAQAPPPPPPSCFCP